MVLGLGRGPVPPGPPRARIRGVVIVDDPPERDPYPLAAAADANDASTTLPEITKENLFNWGYILISIQLFHDWVRSLLVLVIW